MEDKKEEPTPITETDTETDDKSTDVDPDSTNLQQRKQRKSSVHAGLQKARQSLQALFRRSQSGVPLGNEIEQEDKSDKEETDKNADEVNTPQTEADLTKSDEPPVEQEEELPQKESVEDLKPKVKRSSSGENQLTQDGSKEKGVIRKESEEKEINNKISTNELPQKGVIRKESEEKEINNKISTNELPQKPADSEFKPPTPEPSEHIITTSTKREVISPEPSKPIKYEEERHSNDSMTESKLLLITKLKGLKEKQKIISSDISELKKELEFYLEEPHLSDDTFKLKKCNEQLMNKMDEYEKLTKEIKTLMGLEGSPTSTLRMSRPEIQRPLPVRQTTKPPEVDFCPEKDLPRMIICGTGMQDKLPRIVVCSEPKRKPEVQPSYKPPQSNQAQGISSIGSFQNVPFTQAHRMRMQMPSDMWNIQAKLEAMGHRLAELEMEHCKITSKNLELKRELLVSTQNPGHKMCKRELYMKFRGNTCDARSSSCCQNKSELQTPSTL